MLLHIERGKEFFIENFLMTLQYVIAVTVTGTTLKHICNILPSTKFSLIIAISWNAIETIERNCFKDAPHLKVVKINNNEIHYVAILGFYN